MTHKLLLADDSLTIQKVVELVLAPENFEIRSYNDGEQALQALELFTPDIVLADIEMPKLNGYQLCEKIKNDMATGHIPVILLAGAFEPFDEEYAKSVYADDFIIKPFESQELISKVKALLVSVEPVKQTVAEDSHEEETSLSIDIESLSIPESPGEEISWNEEIQVQEEKVEGQEIVTEADDAGMAGITGFEEELANALKDEAPVQEIHFEEPFATETVETEGAVHSDALASALKDSVERSISSVAPAIIENVTREVVRDLLGSIRNDIDAAIKKIVPEVAEAIIKKEIEKITSEIK